MTRETEYFEAIAARKVVRPRVAAIVLRDGCLLAQRPADDTKAPYALIGGEYELGDTFLSRLRTEFEEETTARLLNARFLFVVENRFRHGGGLIHGVEHYLLAEIDRKDVESRERHLGFHWLPVDQLAEFDLRPHVVREAIVSGEYLTARHLITPFADEGPTT